MTLGIGPLKTDTRDTVKLSWHHVRLINISWRRNRCCLCRLVKEEHAAATWLFIRVKLLSEIKPRFMGNFVYMYYLLSRYFRYHYSKELLACLIIYGTAKIWQTSFKPQLWQCSNESQRYISICKQKVCNLMKVFAMYMYFGSWRKIYGTYDQRVTYKERKGSTTIVSPLHWINRAK